MSGIVGGDVTGFSLQEMMADIRGRNAEESWIFEHDGSGIGAVFPTGDPRGTTVWDDGIRGGVIYGAITNLPELQMEYPDVFKRLLRRPIDTAAAIEGEFLIACYDGAEDEFLIITDKLGARACYYTETDEFRFGTRVNALLSHLDNPSINEQAVSDMMLMGHMWGEHTLIEQVQTLRPATIMEVHDDERATTQYWRPDYQAHDPGERYLSELTRRYQQAAKRTSRTLPPEAGIWLSGGLDSRTTAAALLNHTSPNGLESLVAYTYDANPPTSDNPRIAADVARELGMEFVEVPLTAETLADNFERIIEVTDGMVRWTTLTNLSSTYQIGRNTPVLMEGMQGALVGDHLLQYHLNGSRSVVETQYASEATESTETVKYLLKTNVDPLASFKEEATRASGSTYREKVLDIHFQNYYSRSALLSNRVMRDCVGSRVVHVDGDYLEWCARLPQVYRKGTFPFTEHIVQADAGGVPYGTSRAKLELCRRIHPELANITYERTKVKPSRPYQLHAAGFVANVVINRLRSKPTYGSGQLADFWIRDTESYIHHRVTELMDDACDRSLFNANAVREIYTSHMEGENNASLIAHITTLEYWLQENFD